MRGHGGKDRTTNIGEALSGCGEQDRKGVDGPKEGEGISQSKLERMGMMGKWMEAETHLGIGVKLIVGSPLGAYWDGWND
jgi:hypothetical protein